MAHYDTMIAIPQIPPYMETYVKSRSNHFVGENNFKENNSIFLEIQYFLLIACNRVARVV